MEAQTVDREIHSARQGDVTDLQQLFSHVPVDLAVPGTARWQSCVDQSCDTTAWLDITPAPFPLIDPHPISHVTFQMTSANISKKKKGQAPRAWDL